MLQFLAGVILKAAGWSGPGFGIGMILEGAGFIIYITGCQSYAEEKGWPAWLGWLGVFNLLGLLILLCLPIRTK